MHFQWKLAYIQYGRKLSINILNDFVYVESSDFYTQLNPDLYWASRYICIYRAVHGNIILKAMKHARLVRFPYKAIPNTSDMILFFILNREQLSRKGCLSEKKHQGPSIEKWQLIYFSWSYMRIIYTQSCAIFGILQPPPFWSNRKYVIS